jgi:putative ATP-dependent endonuclease of OLD family
LKSSLPPCNRTNRSHEGCGEEWESGDVVWLGLCLNDQLDAGGVGLRRFSRIYQRSAPDKDGVIPVKVACITDLDIMPDCAPEIVGRVDAGAAWPEKNKRRWRAKGDFTTPELDQKRDEIIAKASGQNVETFVAGEWTLEYDLAHAGLAREVFIASRLAKNDDQIASGKTSIFRVARKRSVAECPENDHPSG